MIVQTLPTIAAEEAVNAFVTMVKSLIPHDPNDAYFTHDWSGLWRELATGGWTACADGATPGQDGEFSLLDLTYLAERWGGYLVPLPLVQTLAVRRWLVNKPDAALCLTYLAGENGLGLAVHGELATWILSGDGLQERVSLGPASAVDGFAASMPISLGLRGAMAPAEMRREAIVLASSEAIGAATMALNRTVDYVRMREQFGRPVGSFQAIKHKLADLHCRIELSRSAIVWSCAEPAATLDASAAVLEHCLRVAEGCVQAHGGIGFTWEASIHRYYRHIMAMRRLINSAASTMVGS